jgi:hypothetical protein
VNVVLGLLLSATLAIAPPASSSARRTSRPAERAPIFLQIDSHDAVGLEYVERMRTALDESLFYRPVFDPERANFVVGILTMDPNGIDKDPTTTGPATVASITLRRAHGKGPAEFVYSWVLVAKRSTLDSLVDEALSAIDRQIQDFEAPALMFVDEAPVNLRNDDTVGPNRPLGEMTDPSRIHPKG